MTPEDAIVRLRDLSHNGRLHGTGTITLEHADLCALRELERGDRICPLTGPLVPLYWEDRSARHRLQYLVAHVHAQVARGRPPMSDAVAHDLREALLDLRQIEEAWRTTCDVLSREREADEAARQAYAEAHQPEISTEVAEAPTTYGFDLYVGEVSFVHDAARSHGYCTECSESTMLTLGLTDRNGGSWCLDCIQKRADEGGYEGVLPRACATCEGRGETPIPYPEGGEALVTCVGCAGRGLAVGTKSGRGLAVGTKSGGGGR